MTLTNVLHGFGTALTLQNMIYLTIGCAVGMIVGILPGVGQSTGMALLIPITFHLPVEGSVIMLAGIFYAAMYGGTITTILLNVPGESESVATAFDGYPMAQQGRGGAALGIAAIGSFVGGTLATLGVVVAAAPLANVAIHLGPPEYFALLLLGLSLVVGLLGRSIIKGLLAASIGLLLSQVGLDPVVGVPRFTLGTVNLFDGIPLLAVLMGLFGVSDILLDAETPAEQKSLAEVGRPLPTVTDLRNSAGPVARGTIVGFLLGVVPGMVAAVSTFLSYVLEKRISKHSERFGQGAIEGVAGPETANNSFANASFIPLFALGIPGSAALAILMSAFVIHGVTPGPLMFQDHSDVAWALIVSMWVGNLVLLIMNIPLIRVWILILKIPYGLLAPMVLVIATAGIYSVRNNLTDLWFLLIFSAVAYLMKKLDFPLAPAALAFVLGDQIELTFRQSLVLSYGNYAVFLERPISLVLLLVATISVLGLAIGRRRDRGSEFVETNQGIDTR